MRVAVLVTCFNRISVTLRGLTTLFDAENNQSIASVTVFLVDDASPDNTGEIVKRHFPQVHVVHGTGQLYWNRGMCLAYQTARSAGPFDAYLLFNDDTELMQAALQKMFRAYLEINKRAQAAIVGAVCSRMTGTTTYAGFAITRKYRPATFSPVLPDGTMRECDTFNGNCALIPAHVMDEVGGLDPAYHHSYGDLDLGLMLGRLGCKIFLLPDHLGYCEQGVDRATPKFLTRMQQLFTPPHPISDQVHFTFKRYPWPLAAPISVIQVAKRITLAFLPRRNGPSP